MEATMSYVDGFIVPVPKQNLEKYREVSSKAGELWMEYGALEYYECVADDVKAGEVTSFPQGVLLEPDEVVIFAWIRYESRAQRDEINAKVMSDPRMKMDPENMPFDGKRMVFGGFNAIVELSAGSRQRKAS
jgi:uncharacterized protein YbaA (DUF1428 family)